MEIVEWTKCILPQRIMRYVHTNIISKDWKKLAAFYQTVFECEPVPPQRAQAGTWLSQGSGVKNASLEGVHLRLPGYGPQGPTLEIYSYDRMLEKHGDAAANKQGLGHLAFEVEDVDSVLNQVMDQGGKAVGQVTTHTIPGQGKITFVYCTDPEDNIIELQRWH